MQFSTSSKYFLLAGIVISMVVWGISWPSAKVLTNYAAPLQVAFIRFIFTFAGVFVLLKMIGIQMVIKKQGIPYMLLSAILLSAYSILFFSGLKKGTPGAGGVLVTTTTPLASYFLAMLVQRRKPTTKEFIGLSVGIIGGCFLLRLWDNYANILASGNLFFLLSTITWAVLSRITAKSAQYGSPLAFTMWVYLCCAFILLFFVDLPQTLSVVRHGDVLFWGNMLFNAVVNAGMATTFFFYATSKLGAERTSSFIYIVPFSAAVFSFLFLDEIIMWNTVVGGVLGICAVLIINKRNRV